MKSCGSTTEPQPPLPIAAPGPASSVPKMPRSESPHIRFAPPVHSTVLRRYSVRLSARATSSSRVNGVEADTSVRPVPAIVPPVHSSVRTSTRPAPSSVPASSRSATPGVRPVTVSVAPDAMAIEPFTSADPTVASSSMIDAPSVCRSGQNPWAPPRSPSSPAWRTHRRRAPPTDRCTPARVRTTSRTPPNPARPPTTRTTPHDDGHDACSCCSPCEWATPVSGETETTASCSKEVCGLPGASSCSGAAATARAGCRASAHPLTATTRRRERNP